VVTSSGWPRIVVLGAGIVGSAIACELARRGARVTLTDARDLGRGATQASAGMLAPFTEAEPGTILSGLCAEGLAGYDEAVARVRRDSGCELEYARTGSVEVALDDSAAAHFRDAERTLHAQGIACTWREAADARRADPGLTSSTLGSLEIPAHGFVAVMPFARALLAAARAHGATFLAGVRAERVRPRGDHLEVSMAGGAMLAADSVVVCTGSWSSNLLIDGDEAPPVRPVRGQLLELRPANLVASRILWGPRCYLVPWSSGALLVGATVEEAGFDERTTVDGVAGLMSAAVELVPALGDATLVEARVGLRPASADGLPIVGAGDVPGVIYAIGHYRNGVLLAPLTAAIVADLVLEGRRHHALEALSPARFTARARP